MLALGSDTLDEQEHSLADIQLSQEPPYHVSVSGGLPEDGKHTPSSQPVRPWSAGSRPTSALGGSRPQPPSAVHNEGSAAEEQRVDGAVDSQQGTAVVRDKAVAPGARIASASKARPQSSKGRPTSARPNLQQQHQQRSASAHQQQHKHAAVQQQRPQEQQEMYNVVKQQLQIPRLNFTSVTPANKMRSASFPQQGLLQPPAHKVPEVITDLVTAANSQADVSNDHKGLFQSATDAAAAASPGQRRASVVIIDGSSNSGSVTTCADDCRNSMNRSSVQDGTFGASCNVISGAGNIRSRTESSRVGDGVLGNGTEQQGQLNVLGTIEEEDSVLRSQRQHQTDSLQIPRCASPVDLAADVSFDNSSYANSGRNSPASAYHRQKQRPYSSSSRRQHDVNTANLLNNNSSGRVLQSEQQQVLQASASESLEQQHPQQQQQPPQQGYQVSAADSSFYGALANDNYQPRDRPWSAAATNAARKLYGSQPLQFGGGAQQQQQQRKRCGSAHPYYSIDTRLMVRSAGVFTPSASLAASRGAGFRMQQNRPHSSSYPLPPHHSSSSRSAAAATAAAQAAAAASLNSSLSASRCCSRQQQQRSLQQWESGSPHRYSDQRGHSGDSDLACVATAGSVEILDDHDAQVQDHDHQQQQQQQQQQQAAKQLLDEASLHPADNASEVPAAAEKHDELIQQQRQQQQQQQRSRSSVSQQVTGREGSTAGHTSYRLPASRPVSAAAVVAAKERSNQQARLASAKVVRNLNTPLWSDHSTAARGNLGGGRAGGVAGAGGLSAGGRGADANIEQVVVRSSRKGGSKRH